LARETAIPGEACLALNAEKLTEPIIITLTETSVLSRIKCTYQSPTNGSQQGGRWWLWNAETVLMYGWRRIPSCICLGAFHNA
jgi:hypothetical protein